MIGEPREDKEPLPVNPAVVAAAIVSGATRRDAERYARIVALAVLILESARAAMPVGQLQGEIRRRGIDPISRLVLDPALAAGIAAGELCRRADGFIDFGPF